LAAAPCSAQHRAGAVVEAREGYTPMMTYRILCFLALCICLVFIFYYPWTVFFLAPLWVAFAFLLWKIAMVGISEPNRAIIFRLEVFHHVAKSGYTFLMPGLDRVERMISTAEQMMDFKVPQFYTADGERPTCNLEVTWKVRNDVEGRVADKVREMALMNDEHRKKLVEQSAITITRQLALSYTSDQIKDTRIREGFCTTVRQAANEILHGYGLTIERVFWRGSMPYPEVQGAVVRGLVEEAEVKAMVKAIKMIREELGDSISAEDLYTMYEYITLMKNRGINPFDRGGLPKN
jgi:regulator of protease activity HflC (stomatin/prohibitin superfamily)